MDRHTCVSQHPAPEGYVVKKSRRLSTEAFSSSPPRRNRRLRVSEDARRRSIRACTACRRVKEKCSGRQPCERCLRSGRRCEFIAVEPVGRPPAPSISGAGPLPEAPEERMRLLETVASHFLGNVSLDLDNLRHIVERIQGPSRPSDTVSALDLDDFDALTLEDENFTVKTVSRNTAHYSGEFSHWNFSHKVRQKVDHYLGANRSASWEDGDIPSATMQNVPDSRLVTLKAMSIVEYWRATQLQSSGNQVQSVIKCLPPKHIAEFLVQIYFEFAQTICFYAEEEWIYEKLSLLYDSPGDATSADAAWICSIFMVLAIGTQFVHMSSAQSKTGPLGDDDRGEEVGTTFYKAATKLLPDIITIASTESVQACLLLGHYTLPLDAHGLAYTYLGLAVKMAIQNGMHRKYTGLELDPWTIETRNRLWWTAYTVERRICVLHGRPPSITPAEVDADLPKDLPEFRQGLEPLKRFDSMLALLQLTMRLGDIANSIWLLRRCPKASQPTYFDRMLAIRQGLQTWWATLEEDIRSPSPESPLLRAHVHLKLFFHLAHIFIGRPFVFYDSSYPSPGSGLAELNSPRRSRRATLVTDALEAAFDVIDLIKLLHDTTGLARASYVEFTSCRAALLLLLAQSVSQRTDRLASSVELGLRLIKSMTTVNNASAMSDTSVIETIELGVRRLHSQRSVPIGVDAMPGDLGSKTGYDRFREWTALWKDVGGNAAGGDAAAIAQTDPASNQVAPEFSFTNDGMMSWPDESAAMADPMTWTAPASDDLQTGSFLNLFSDAEAAEVAMIANLEMAGQQPGWDGLG
ncbi:hypothetical protein GQ53DRAFT_796170 [Thozetella sp. PMI_491]|nr:hypothetical protein GQ53DRAFT_796170 [Thozetella sp. PMI_491]